MLYVPDNTCAVLVYLGLVLSVLVLAYGFNAYRCFSKNLAAAKASGIPYIRTPIFLFNLFWILSHRLILPQLRKLPRSWTWPWLEVMDTQWTWQQQYGFYKEFGADTFLTVSPNVNILWTADADVISQITNRRIDFPKPIHMYRSVDIFGKNVVSTEGSVWRQHRKITSPPFTEKNNYMVWQESIHQARAMLEAWVGPNGDEIRTISSVAADAMRLSLHVISRAGFGVQLKWPGISDASDSGANMERQSGTQDINAIDIGKGHTMTYTDALQTLLDHIVVVMLMPKFLLENLPMKGIRTANESYIEWGKYMKEMFQAKKAEIASGKEQEGLDLMGALVKGAGFTSRNLSAGSPPREGLKDGKQALADSEILGNAFIIILAGHETAANSIHFSTLYLALNIASQRRLQSELDTIFQGRPPSQWNYDKDLPKLFSGMAGAILAEELRLIPPVTNIPKSTLPKSPQPIVINGKKCIVPAGTLINLSSNCVHRNPKFWPAGPPSNPQTPFHPTSNTDNDLEEFKPERWFVEGSHSATNLIPNRASGHANNHATPPTTKVDSLAPSAIPKSAETEDLGVNTSADTAHNLYHPIKGSYIPFSEGYRACIGRRFAQVEVLAVLAVLFSQYSVEIAVDDWASDAEIEKMSESERREVWGKARAAAMHLLSTGLESIITLQMRKGKVAMRWVRRGTERFDFR